MSLALTACAETLEHALVQIDGECPLITLAVIAAVAVRAVFELQLIALLAGFVASG